MATHGTPGFVSYVRNLRRQRSAELVAAQSNAARPGEFKASLVEAPLKDTDNLAHVFAYHRHRTTLPGAE